MATEFPNSYKDPLYASLDAQTTQKLGLPDGLLSSIRLNGERTNHGQVSSAGATTPYQFTPTTAKLIEKKYGIDPTLSPQNASEAAGLLLQEGLKRNNNDPALAVAEYVGGTNRDNWGPVTKSYVARVTGGLSATAAPSSEMPSKTAPGQSTFDRVSASMDKPNPSSLATVLKAYQSGQMSPEDAKTFEASVNDGHVMLPQGVSLNVASSGAPAMPDALAKAYQSGQMDPADKAQLDDLIKQGVVSAPKGANQIPGQTEGAPSNIAQRQADPTLGQQIVGAGEAALNLGTGLASGAVAPVVGLGTALTSPDASKGSLQGASNAAEQFAQNNTYAPRTAAGQNQAEAVGNVMANAAPLMGHGGELAAIGQLAKPTTQVIAPVVRDTVGAAAQNVASGVRNAIPDVVANIPAKVGEMMGREPAPRPTPGTMGSVGAMGVDIATQRRMAANELPVPLDITEAMATREYGQQRFEKETAKHPELGAPLRERVQELNKGILQNFDAMVDLTGAESPDLRATGTVVTQALRDQLARDKTKVRVAYKAAEKAGDMEAPVTLGSFVEHLNENAPDAAVAPLLDAAKKRALQLGIATEGADGALIAQPVTLKTAETARRAISNATGFDPTNVYHGTLLKQAIDSSTEGLGGNLYRAARAERARLAENYQNHAAISDLIGTKRGTGDRQVAVEDVFRRSILNGSVDDVRQVRRVLQRSGEQGVQAWKELQGQTLKNIKEQAIGSARDAAGNATVSAHALNKAVTALDNSGKLDFIFGKKGAETVRTLNDVVNSIRTSPEGAVNNSSTASVLAGLIDVGFTVGSGGVPLPVATGLRIAVNNVKDRRIRAQVSQALGDAKRREAAKPKPIPMKKTIH